MTTRAAPALGVVCLALTLMVASVGDLRSHDRPPLNAPTDITLPGDTITFSTYDFRQSGVGGVDWPVAFVFTGNATVAKVVDGLCTQTEHAWRYCDQGGPMFLYADESPTVISSSVGSGTGTGTGGFTGFLSNAGVKRFAEDCTTNMFTAHMRLYAPKSTNGQSFVSATFGNVVIATVHLDFQDHTGCSARIHGFPDVAEQWFIEAMRTIDGWNVAPHAMALGNASDEYVVMRDLSGAMVPHVYGNDGMATQVVVP